MHFGLRTVSTGRYSNTLLLRFVLDYYCVGFSIINISFLFMQFCHCYYSLSLIIMNYYVYQKAPKFQAIWKNVTPPPSGAQLVTQTLKCYRDIKIKPSQQQ
jgi:hypothetical protein